MTNVRQEFISRLKTIPVTLVELPYCDRFEIILSLLSGNQPAEANKVILGLLAEAITRQQTDNSRLFLAISELPGIDRQIRDLALDSLVFFENPGGSAKTKATLLEELNGLRGSRS